MSVRNASNPLPSAPLFPDEKRTHLCSWYPSLFLPPLPFLILSPTVYRRQNTLMCHRFQWDISLKMINYPTEISGVSKCLFMLLLKALCAERVLCLMLLLMTLICSQNWALHKSFHTMISYINSISVLCFT